MFGEVTLFKVGLREVTGWGAFWSTMSSLLFVLDLRRASRIPWLLFHSAGTHCVPSYLEGRWKTRYMKLCVRLELQNSGYPLQHEWIFFPSLQKQVSPLCSNPSSGSGQLCQGIRQFSFNLNAHQLHTENQQSDLMENN